MNTHQDPYLFDDEAENHRSGRQHYNRNLSHREGYHPGRSDQSRWDEGNYFHTGPSQRGSQQYRQAHHPQQNVHQHYANRPGSSYRHPEQKINFGDSRASHEQTSYDRYKPYRTDSSYFRHEPSARDIYKADDYRYRSGHYNWNAVSVNPHGADDYDADDLDRHQRYAEGHRMHYYEQDRDRDQGFFGRIAHGLKDAWHTVTHMPDEDDTYRDESGRLQHRSEPTGRRFNRGYESGPRWADEHRSRHDQNAYTRWPEDPNRNRRGQEHGYNRDPNNDW